MPPAKKATLEQLVPKARKGIKATPEQLEPLAKTEPTASPLIKSQSPAALTARSRRGLHLSKAKREIKVTLEQLVLLVKRVIKATPEQPVPLVKTEPTVSPLIRSQSPAALTAQSRRGLHLSKAKKATLEQLVPKVRKGIKAKRATLGKTVQM